MRKETSINYRNETALIQGCPLAAALKIIGGRWKMMLLWYISRGLNRYGLLKKTIPHISEKMLYQQLRELEKDALLLRIVETRAVRYELTELAQSLQPILADLEDWGQRNRISGQLLAKGCESDTQPRAARAGTRIVG